MKSQDTWHSDLIEQARYRMDESLRMIKKSLERLDEEDIWKRPNTSSNSVGNLILHLCGNIRQYIISSLGGQPDLRQRDNEFSARGDKSKKALIELLEQVIEESEAVLTSVSTDELLRNREVQGFTMSGIGVVLHVVEHLSYHTGQIAFWTKLLKDEDLGFYDGFDLNLKNT